MSDPVIERAYEFLRAHTTGDLRFDENLRPVKYVVQPDGRLAASVMVAMLQSFDTVMFVPEYQEDAMELMVSLEAFEEEGSDGIAADRWRIYHGEPDDVRWAFLSIDTARFEEMVIDGEALMRKNVIATDEPSVCRDMNQRPDDLRRLCSKFANIDIEEPVMVGIDPLGFDVRARFDIFRVPLLESCESSERVHEILKDMIDSC